MEKRKAVVIAAVVAAATIGTAVVLMPVQAAELSGKLTIAGSTTVLPINQDCARIFWDMYPDLRISVSGGGSGHGVRAVGAGEIDIGAASRDVKTEEMAREALVKPSNGEVRATVAGDEKSIAYLSLGYVDPALKALMIDGVEVTVDNVLSGDYAISRNLYLITKGAPEPLESAFIAFVLSEEGQAVVEDMGYIKVAVDDTPSPTPEAMLEETPTPEETPKTSGFEALFAIACVLASAYAVWRRRR